MNYKMSTKKYLPSFLVQILKKLRVHTIEKLSRKRQHAQLKKFKHETVSEVVFEGTQINILIKPNNGWVDNYIFLNSVHEPDILKIIKDNLKEGDVALDIGANIGQHTMFMAKFVGEEGSVFAFEPLESNVDSISKSISLNNAKNIVLENMAVGEGDGVVEMHIPENANDRSSRKLVGVKSDTKQQVKMIALDKYFGDKKIDFIKIDTEGFEPEVLTGAKKLISKHKPIILLEFAPKFYSHRKVDGNDLLNYLASENYVLRDTPSGYGTVADVKKYMDYLTKGGGGISNILAIQDN